MGEKIDTNYFVETPEGIKLSMRIASTPVRMMAFVIDFFIRIALWIGGVIILGIFNMDAYLGLLLLYLWSYVCIYFCSYLRM